MQPKRLVVIGSSAGGIEALRRLLAGLPDDFAAAVAVVVHTAAWSPGLLHEILGRSGSLPSVRAASGTPLQQGHVYVAPPDHHLIVEPGKLRITKGPRENRFRPAIDPLFRSAAQVYGPAAIGVILTGNLDDGVAGLWAIKQLGGIAVVQQPADAPFPSMPESAIRHVAVDHVVTLAEMPRLLVELTAHPVPAAATPAAAAAVALEVEMAAEQDPLYAGLMQIAEPSPLTCPECHGVLLQLKQAGPLRFRCHTGHAYSAETLLAATDEAIEASLWAAIRLMHEGTILLRRFADHLDAVHPPASSAALRGRAEELRRKSDALRDLVGPLAVTPATD